MADSPFIFEANESNFEQYVIHNSHQVPVLVDFWADWCQPCQVLMPVLAQVVESYQGAVILVKVNSDENQGLAARFGVRSLPTVKLFKGGQVVDEFMGVQPESEIRAMINKHRVRPTEPYRQQALAMQQQGDLDGALNIMKQVVEHEPDFYEAVFETAGMLVAKDDINTAEALLNTIPEGEVSAPELNALLSEIKLAKLQAQAADIDTSALEQRIAENPDDLDAYLEMAQALIAAGEFERGLENYLTVMKRDASYKEGAGRQGLLDTFEVLGAANPLVKKYRGKLFSLLY